MLIVHEQTNRHQSCDRANSVYRIITRNLINTLLNSPNHPAALGALPSTPIYLSPAAYPHRSRSDYAWHYIYQALEAILMQKGGPVFVRTRVKVDIRL
jgi:hypothetical protein